jgi:hypothetical protein
MNYKLLFTVATLSLSTLAASDASKTRPANNSHMGAEGYFKGYTMFPKTMTGDAYELSSDNALTQHVPFTAMSSATHDFFKACLEDPANQNIFDHAQAFGILIHGGKIYTILSNNRTYCFYKPSAATAPLSTAPYYSVDAGYSEKTYGCRAINSADIRLIFGYTSNQALIQQVFNSIRKTGKIAEHLHNDLNAPATTERAETLAAVAHAVVAARADSGMSAGAGAPAGGGSGFAMPAPEAVDPRDAEIQRLRQENRRLRWLLKTCYQNKPDITDAEVDQMINEGLEVAATSD